MKKLMLTKKYQTYSEYIDSGVEWLGSIPKNWAPTTLRSVSCDNNERNTNGQNERLLSLSYGSIVEKDIQSDEGLLPASFNTYQIVRKGDIVLRLTDLQNDKKSLRVGFVDVDNGIITSAYTGLRLSGIMSKYAYYLLHSYDLQKIYYNLGGGVRQALDYNSLRYLPIILPPTVTQESIVVFLDEKTALIDLIIEKKKKQIELLKEKRAAVINQVVTKGSEKNVEMVDSGVDWIGKIPKGWIFDRVSHHTVLSTGGVWGEDDLSDEGVIVLRSTEIKQNGEWELSEAVSRKLTALEKKKAGLLEGDLLLTKSSGSTEHLGKTAIVTRMMALEKYAYSNFMQRIRLDDKFEPRYFFYLINNKIGRDQIRYWGSTTSGLVNLNRSIIGRFIFPIPPRKAQIEICKLLDTEVMLVDRMISRVSDSIDLLQEFKSSLITNVVTGKIKV